METGKSEKIDSGVYRFEVSGDGKTVGYWDEDGNLYLKTSDSEREMLDRDVSNVYYISENFDSVIYKRDGDVYRMTANREKEMLASDVDRVIRVYSSGEIYFVRGTSSELKLIDFVEDDKKLSDAEMTEPVAPQTPDFGAFSSEEEYLAAYESFEDAWGDYEEAYAEYENKLWRDELRASLEESSLEVYFGELWYYDGAEARLVSDSFFSSRELADENPVVVYREYDFDEAEKIRLSEIGYSISYYAVESMVQTALSESAKWCVAEGTKVTFLEFDGASALHIDSDGDTLYYIDNLDTESGSGDLYKIAVSGEESGVIELCDSDVYSGYISFVGDDKPAYFKDFDTESAKGELYIDGEMIDYDVCAYDISFDGENGRLIYFTDWDFERGYGTLKIWREGETISVRDEVHSYALSAKGGILYLSDYSLRYYTGDLYIYSDKKDESEMVDTEVTAIIPVYGGVFGMNYFVF